MGAANSPRTNAPAKPRVIFFGTPACAADTLAALVQAQYPIVAAVTQPDRPSGRHAHPQASPVKTLATSAGVAVLQPKSRAELASSLQAHDAEVGVLFAYGAIIPNAALRHFPHGIINIHPSLLPKHRGPSPVPAAILSGEPTTGVTLILLDTEVDHGPILAQRSLQIEPGETAEHLHQRLAQLGIALLIQTLPAWIAGGVIAKPQDHTRATATRMLQRDDGHIDWKLPAELIYRRYRAFTPWPGSYTHLQGQRVKLLRAKLASSGTPQEPPGHLRLHDGVVEVSCGDGYLVLDEVQLESRRPTAAADLIKGHPGFLQTVLE